MGVRGCEGGGEGLKVGVRGCEGGGEGLKVGVRAVWMGVRDVG